MPCSLLYQSITNECDIGIRATDLCLFDKGDFCFLKGPMANSLLIDCYATALLNVSGVECTETCGQAVETFISNAGCCVEFWQDHRYYTESGTGSTIGGIFSACNVEIPEACILRTPPPEFLNCAHEFQAQSTANQVGSPGLLVIIIVGFLTVIL